MVEASKKASLLATGISEALNTTAFGLIVAVPCMIMYTVLSNMQQRKTRDLDESVVRFLNYLKKKAS
jgi:biopolymer transport protein ExbB/TolQ